MSRSRREESDNEPQPREPRPSGPCEGCPRRTRASGRRPPENRTVGFGGNGATSAANAPARPGRAGRSGRERRCPLQRWRKRSRVDRRHAALLERLAALCHRGRRSDGRAPAPPRPAPSAPRPGSPPMRASRRRSACGRVRFPEMKVRSFRTQWTCPSAAFREFGSGGNNSRGDADGEKPRHSAGEAPRVANDAGVIALSHRERPALCLSRLAPRRTGHRALAGSG